MAFDIIRLGIIWLLVMLDFIGVVFVICYIYWHIVVAMLIESLKQENSCTFWIRRLSGCQDTFSCTK